MKKNIALVTIALLGFGAVVVKAQDSAHVSKTAVHAHKRVRSHKYVAHHTAVAHSSTNADGSGRSSSTHISVRKDSAPGHVHTAKHVVKKTANQ